jgi:hypothetical protein
MNSGWTALAVIILMASMIAFLVGAVLFVMYLVTVWEWNEDNILALSLMGGSLLAIASMGVGIAAE